MKIEKLSLAHQSLLDLRFQSLGLCLSEYSFASRYLFRDTHDFHIIFDEQMVWLRGKTRDGVKYLMPTEDVRKISPSFLLARLQWVDCFYPIPEGWISFFSTDSFQISFNRDDSDYLFTREKIADYPGRHLSAKRNLVRQFLNAHTPEVVPYETKLAEDALSVLTIWQSAFQGQKTDFLSCQEGLQLADKLGLIGYMIYIEKRPAAFILGEALHGIFVIHFAKALTEYKGIYPFLFKEIAQRSFPQAKVNYLNWEQDLGQEGLRQSKLSYQPDTLLSKFRVYVARV